MVDKTLGSMKWKELKGDGLMVVSFDEIPDDDYNELYGRIQKLKMEELFEEPSKYEDDEELYNQE